KLLKFDERFNIFWNVINGGGLKIFPIPGDANNTWLDFNEIRETDLPAEITTAADALALGLRDMDNGRIRLALETMRTLQATHGAEVLPSGASLDAELWLNAHHPFRNVTLPYLVAFLVLIVAFFWSLGKRNGEPYRWRHPLYAIGLLVYWCATGYLLYAFVLRWVASARAPLSNGYESLIFIALSTAIAGAIFEFRDRRGSAAAVSALLTTLILSVAMLSTFDPSIGPLMPVLASYWLNIHVTIITASYGFLGLSCLLGLLTLVLFVIDRRRPTPAVVRTVGILDQLNVDVMIAGVGLLAAGTLLGGVWANESWGRYWGWDPKETWALVSILLYAMILHLRWIPRLANTFVQAAGSFLAIWSIIMTYFGVNYLLMGLHSYAAGDKVAIPLWATVSCLLSVVFSVIAYRAWVGRRNSWRRDPASALDLGQQAS
ncbi:cytochrome c biogenesis protein CcsA, partial [bacterium]|nr:cytochrome c biogenesis protein CcsA [bacterium]